MAHGADGPGDPPSDDVLQARVLMEGVPTQWTEPEERVHSDGLKRALKMLPPPPPGHFRVVRTFTMDNDDGELRQGYVDVEIPGSRGRQVEPPPTAVMEWLYKQALANGAQVNIIPEELVTACAVAAPEQTGTLEPGGPPARGPGPGHGKRASQPHPRGSPEQRAFGVQERLRAKLKHKQHEQQSDAGAASSSSSAPAGIFDHVLPEAMASAKKKAAAKAYLEQKRVESEKELQQAQCMKGIFAALSDLGFGEHPELDEGCLEDCMNISEARAQNIRDFLEEHDRMKEEPTDK